VTPPGFSLTRGGPLHNLLARLRVLPQEPHGLARVVPLFIAVTWLPLLVLAVFVKVTGGRLPAEFAAFGVHARLLLAVPLFLYAERALHRRTQRCLERFLEDNWAEDGPDGVARVTASAARWRDSITAEVVCLLLALLGSQVVVAGLADHLGLARGFLTETTWSPSKLWYRLVGLPAYQFLVYRWLWRWLVWARLLWGLSRLRLRPLSTHPDQRGGLAFLAETSPGSRTSGTMTSWPPTWRGASTSAGSSVANARGCWARRHLLAGRPQRGSRRRPADAPVPVRRARGRGGRRVGDRADDSIAPAEVVWLRSDQTRRPGPARLSPLRRRTSLRVRLTSRCSARPDKLSVLELFLAGPVFTHHLDPLVWSNGIE
jgi:hypothetical protein